MCFSASASFIAGSALSVLGVATLREVRHRREVALAAVPLLFGIQQLVEGLLWLSFDFDAPLLKQVTTHVFSFFSHVLWPVFVPLAVGMLETVRGRRNALHGFQAAGLGVGLYLLYVLVRFPVTAEAAPNIVYLSPHFFAVPVMLAYLAATCVGPLFSSHPLVRWFGALALLFFILSYGFFTIAMISVWCFFAALLSALIYLHFRRART